jgi:hypothetical protein
MTGHYKLLMTVAVTGLLEVAVARGATPLPDRSPDETLGTGSCAGSLCHGSIEPWRNSSVLQNEYVTWSRSDPHARTYAVLLNERSREIARKLALPAPAHKSDLCLDCHTYNPKPARRGEGYRATDGVSCEACHGPAQRWIKSHVEPRATHADNLAHGLYPTEDDVARARLCLSCHSGNGDKFVTHRIMAAGHPRMSFELDTFTEIEPAHWRIDADWEQRKGSWDGVRAWAIGQAVAAQELLALLQSRREGDGLFPELVLFDCHSCHHSMTDKRNTAARVGAGPGVVRLNDASLLMLRQIARRVVPDEAGTFAQQVAQLHKAVATGSDALAQAQAVEARITAMIPKIRAHQFSAADLRGVLAGLIDDGLAGQYADYQGAEQATMAVQGVVEFMGRRGLLRTRALQPAMRRLLAMVANDEHYRPAAFEQALRDLKTSIDTKANQ